MWKGKRRFLTSKQNTSVRPLFLPARTKNRSNFAASSYGHHSFFAYDADGFAEKPLEITPHKEFLKACGCKVDSTAIVQVQAEAALESLRVISTDKKTGEEAWIDFSPSPAREMHNTISYDAFLSKYQSSEPGIIADSINANTYSLMVKIFKDRCPYPIIRQAGSNASGKNDGVIYHTFTLCPEILIVSAPCKDTNEDSYGKFSDLTMELLASPYAKSKSTAPSPGESIAKAAQKTLTDLCLGKDVFVSVSFNQ